MIGLSASSGTSDLTGGTLIHHKNLVLRVAETNIRTQQGRYQFVLDPLCISWALPTQSLAQ